MTKYLLLGMRGCQRSFFISNKLSVSHYRFKNYFENKQLRSHIGRAAVLKTGGSEVQISVVQVKHFHFNYFVP